MPSKFSMNLDLENPRHKRVHEALYNEETKRSKLKKGHLTELFITFLERQFDLEGDMRKQVIDYIHDTNETVKTPQTKSDLPVPGDTLTKPLRVNSSIDNLSF